MSDGCREEPESQTPAANPGWERNRRSSWRRDSDRCATFLGTLATLFQHPDFEDAVAAEDAGRLVNLVGSESL